MFPAAFAAAEAHPFALSRTLPAGVGAAGHAPAFRLGVQNTLAHPRPATVAPFTPLHLPLRHADPAPAASPEFNPLVRRRMAMPAIPPGPESDSSLAF